MTHVLLTWPLKKQGKHFKQDSQPELKSPNHDSLLWVCGFKFNQELNHDSISGPEVRCSRGSHIQSLRLDAQKVVPAVMMSLVI